MPDFTFFKEPRTSVYQELFDNTIKLETSSPFIKAFELEGAIAVICFQHATNVPASARTINFEDITDDAGIIIDNNLLNEVFETGTGSNTVDVDFGSIVVRNIKCKARTTNSTNSSGGGSASVSISYSTDDISYSGGGTVASSGGTPSSPNDSGVQTREDVAVNMRFARITFSRTSVNSSVPTNRVFECWDTVGLGTGQLSFEVFNDLEAKWDPIDLGFDALPLQNSDAGSSNTNKTTNGGDTDPNRVWPVGAGKVRAKLVIDDGCNAEIGILKVF